MRRLLVLGAGTAGTIGGEQAARAAARSASGRSRSSTRTPTTTTSRATCCSPSGRYTPDQLTKPRRGLHPRRRGPRPWPASTGSTPTRTRCSSTDGRTLSYDYLVIATGTSPRPDQTPGMADGVCGVGACHEFYTLDGATALAGGARRLARRPPGRPRDRDADQVPGRAAGVHLPRRRVLHRQGHAGPRRDRLRHSARRGVHQAGRVAAARRDARGARDRARSRTSWSTGSTRDAKTLVSMDEREVPFDLLVTVPLNMGADFVARSGLGDELNYVPVDRAHPAVARRTTTSSRSATPPTSRRRRPARSRTSPSTCSRTTSSTTSRAGR